MFLGKLLTAPTRQAPVYSSAAPDTPVKHREKHTRAVKTVGKLTDESNRFRPGRGWVRIHSAAALLLFRFHEGRGIVKPDIQRTHTRCQEGAPCWGVEAKRTAGYFYALRGTYA